MRAVLVHNAYGSAAPSGENSAFAAECAMLERAGVDVFPYTRSNDELYSSPCGALKASLTAVWNPLAGKALRRFVRRCSADVVHAHNTFPLFSAAIFKALCGERAAVVQTLHNYRVGCAAGTLFRHGRKCSECIDKRSVWPALRHRCYRGSRAATLPVAAMIAAQRASGILGHAVDHFICLTEYQRSVLLACGLPPDRISIKPNHAPAPARPLPWSARERKAVFIGRLAEYKGIHVLAAACRRLGPGAPRLEIIGDGPSRAALERELAGAATFTGQLDPPDVQARLATAQMVLIPSLCPEGFPMVLRESMACGVPAVASRLGGLRESVVDGETGWLFTTGAPDELANIVEQAFTDDGGELERRGRAAHRRFLDHYSERANIETLLAIYDKAKSHRARRF